MQTFSFADSKLGYLTAAKGALVVRVKSCRATPHHGAVTVTPLKTLAAAAGGGDNDVKTAACNHIADETGNFTLVQRRSLAYRIGLLYLCTAMDGYPILTTRSSSRDEITNVNCLTTTPILQSTIDLRINYGTYIGHGVFTVNWKQQETIATVKRNLNDKLQVSNGEIHFTRECRREFSYAH